MKVVVASGVREREPRAYRALERKANRIRTPHLGYVWEELQSPANGKNLAKCLIDRFCTFGVVGNSLKRDMKKAPQVGLEPTTLRLTAGCSAIELLRSNGTDGDNFRRRDPQRVAKAETPGQWAFATPATPD